MSQKHQLSNKPLPPSKKQKTDNNKSRKKYTKRDEYINLDITDEYSSAKQAKEIVREQFSRR